MSQFEHIDDYLTNRLDDGARSAFEQRMEADAQLRSEVKMQQGIIKSVRSARAAELKAMLNNVPVGGATSAITAKIAIATISAGIVATALYFGLRSTPAQESYTESNTQSVEDQIAEEQITPAPEENTEAIVVTPEENKTEPIKTQEQQRSSGIKKMPDNKSVSPRVEVMDLTEDMSSNSSPSEEPKAIAKPTISASSVEVEIGAANSAYGFHYQFTDDKLVLYGPFDSSLYEIIEINGGTHTLFLYYKNSYYHLDNKEQKVTPLIMIRDIELLGKLDKYRKKN